MSRSSATRDPMSKRCASSTWLACVFVSCMAVVPMACPADLHNATGLPLYPTLTSAVLEKFLHTDVLGHWCMHLAARSPDSRDAVANWYRRAFARASETDLSHDPAYQSRGTLDGIKLTNDIDSIAIYRMAGSPATFIDLIRCSPVR